MVSASLAPPCRKAWAGYCASPVPSRVGGASSMHCLAPHPATATLRPAVTTTPPRGRSWSRTAPAVGAVDHRDHRRPGLAGPVVFPSLGSHSLSSLEMTTDNRLHETVQHTCKTMIHTHHTHRIVGDRDYRQHVRNTTKYNTWTIGDIHDITFVA